MHSPVPAAAFLQLPVTAWIASNELAFAIPALLPVGPGHTLIVPRRLVTSYFDATRNEKIALWALVDEVKVFGANAQGVDRWIDTGWGIVILLGTGEG